MDAGPPMLSAAGDMFNTACTIVDSRTFNYSVPGQTDALKSLQDHTAHEALHTSTAVSRQDLCTPGTRTFTLGRLQSLARASDPESPDIIWMHGPAGAGKSAIMRTLANALASDGNLLASFFFFRSDSRRNTSAPFIPTLALQASAIIPETRVHIAESIQQHPTLFSQPAHFQSPHILETPLVHAATNTSDQLLWKVDAPLAIIVDGLDECTDADGQVEIIKALAQLASTIRSRTMRRIKIFVASRPEHQIKSQFDALHSAGHCTILPLDSSDANLHLYYDEQFDKIRKKFNLPESWPSKAEREWLMDKTSGQYAFAGVSTRFLAGGDPIIRLHIIQQAFQTHDLQPFEPLDILYATVFDQIPQEMVHWAVSVLRLILREGWITTYNPILEPIFQLPPGSIHRLAPYLASLIDFGNELQPYHASLSDFLVDPSRSTRFSLYIDDGTLCSAVVKGLLAVVSKPTQTARLTIQQMAALQKFLVLYPRSNLFSKFPFDDLGFHIARVDPSQLDILSFGLFGYLIHIFDAQLSNHPRRFRFLSLWYRLRFATPRSLHVVSKRKVSLYGVAPGRDKICGMDILRLWCEYGTDVFTAGSEPGEEVWDRYRRTLEVVGDLIKHIFQDDEQLRAIDCTTGWKISFCELLEAPSKSWSEDNIGLYNLCATVANAFLRNPDDKRLLRRAMKTLADLLEPPKGDNIHPCLAIFVRCPLHRPIGGGGALQSSCQDCLSRLEEVRGSLLDVWFTSAKKCQQSFEAFLSAYNLALELPLVWDNTRAVKRMLWSGEVILGSSKFRLATTLQRNQRSELLGITKTLENRVEELKGSESSSSSWNG